MIYFEVITRKFVLLDEKTIAESFNKIFYYLVVAYLPFEKKKKNAKK